MSTGTTRDTAIICAAAVVATGILSIPFALGGDNAASLDYLVWIVFFMVAGLGIALRYRYLTVKKKAETEATGVEQYRRLAEQYRRLADTALTTQEHTDLKLGGISAQLDHLREQTASLHKILKDVE